MFNHKDFGKPITQELSDKLKEHTCPLDYADVSSLTGVSTSTIRDVVRRVNHLTDTNSVAILELVKVADRKCSASIVNAKEAQKFFKKNFHLQGHE